MANPWELDWEATPEKVDQDASARTSKLDAGYYRVRVTGYDVGKEKGELKFKFQVTEGPAKGRWHFESLDNPRFSSDEKLAKVHADIAKTWASRFECIPRGTLGRAAPDWDKAVGKEMVIKIGVRKWTSPDKKTSGESHEIGWSGLWPLNHEDVGRLKNDVRATLGLPPIAGNDPKPDAKADVAANTASATTPIPAKPAVDPMAVDIFN